MYSCYRLEIPIEFRFGLIPGAGVESNFLHILRNGNGKAVLHGTAIAGVLKKTVQKYGVENIPLWFGKGQETSNGKTSSRVQISDVVLDTGNAGINVRTHNAINRHTGAAFDKSLYSMEALPPGTKCIIKVLLDGRDINSEKTNLFKKQLIAAFYEGLYFGGNRNRGVGLATVIGDITQCKYDLCDTESYCQFLDDLYYDRIDKSTCVVVTNENQAYNNTFKIELILGIPRGEDLLVGDGQTIDFVLEPQKVFAADGKEYWRIPGSTFRGIFRAWMTRLAAMEGRQIIDSFDSYYGDENNNIPERDTEKYTGDAIGWAFVGADDVKKREEIKNDPALLNDPIYDLFGSFYKQGRVFFADSISTTPAYKTDCDVRAHVAIDKFTGGGIEGSLYSNAILVQQNIEFPFTIIIEDPKDFELRWIIKSLKALHLGILAIGSSKSSGRLAIKNVKHCSNNSTRIKIEKFLEEHK